ncbi:hypothetical protein C8R45DRAFT_595043 [Mycena sanguinolenta]|nr:hypothetical protein C8R45DRAFT_595043 [Mycena sanguinolenta]
MTARHSLMAASAMLFSSSSILRFAPIGGHQSEHLAPTEWIRTPRTTQLRQHGRNHSELDSCTIWQLASIPARRGATASNRSSNLRNWLFCRAYLYGTIRLESCCVLRIPTCTARVSNWLVRSSSHTLCSAGQVTLLAVVCIGLSCSPQRSSVTFPDLDHSVANRTPDPSRPQHLVILHHQPREKLFAPLDFSRTPRNWLPVWDAASS